MKEAMYRALRPKKAFKIFLIAFSTLIAVNAGAQQVTTLYFLENAPMRHTINPAFQPVSRGYLNFTPLGWMNFSIGNNSLTINDVLFADPKGSGKTVTPLHPNADRMAFLNQIRNMTFINGEMVFSWINVGSRVKDNGYVTIGINQRIEGGVTLPKDIFNFFLGGGMTNLTGINTIALTGMGGRATMYTEISGGYSHKINEHWSVGGKLKVLLGQGFGCLNNKNLAIDASAEQWRLYGDIDLNLAAPINAAYLDGYMVGKNMNEVIDGFSNGSFDPNKLFETGDIMNIVRNVLKPSGYGAALDIGFAWKPIKNLQISAAITDLGFIYWTRGSHYRLSVDTTFVGAGEINYGDPAYRDEQGKFSTSILMDTVVNNLKGLLNGVRVNALTGIGTARMTSARLNVGIDANFWDNRIGIGVVSATRLYNSRLYEEVTFGLSFRPVNWFNIAATYSLMNNGKYSNIGAGLSFMPYDGINLTLMMDYIPTSYAALPNSKLHVLPDKAKMMNLALGFSICWGTNKRDRDKDGVWDKIDTCPDTPRGVQVDEHGCPKENFETEE